MLFIISDKYLLTSVSDQSNHCSQLTLYHLKEDNKSQIDIDLTRIAINNTEEDDKEKNKNIEKANYSIICGAFSSNCKCLAVCDNRKQLIIFSNNENTNDWTSTSKRKVTRNCIKLLFTPNNDSVLCADKSGDVYQYSCSDCSIDGQLLLGHLSMLLDMTLTNDSKYLITCDRDEKIRVSHYPNAYNIKTYCLGHREFVSSIAVFNNQTLVSGSGDGSLRLWNLVDGKEVFALMCDESESIVRADRTQSKFPVKKLVINRSLDPQFLSVSFYKQPIVKIYSIESNCLKLIHSLKLDEEPIDIQFDVSNCGILWILLSKTNNPLNVYEISSDQVKKSNLYVNIIEQLNSNSMFQNNCLDAKGNDELEGLYKHWFNNVEIYLQKKHERQESTKKKKLY